MTIDLGTFNTAIKIVTEPSLLSLTTLGKNIAKVTTCNNFMSAWVRGGKRHKLQKSRKKTVFKRASSPQTIKLEEPI